MILGQQSIFNLIKDSVIKNFEIKNVKSVGIDLRIAAVRKGQYGDWVKEHPLVPWETVQVKLEESVNLPNNICARLYLRSRAICSGLIVSAPLIQPGHNGPLHFMLTNVSQTTMPLKSGDSIASITFELVDSMVPPYSGNYDKVGLDEDPDPFLYRD